MRTPAPAVLLVDGAPLEGTGETTDDLALERFAGQPLIRYVAGTIAAEPSVTEVFVAAPRGRSAAFRSALAGSPARLIAVPPAGDPGGPGHTLLVALDSLLGQSGAAVSPRVAPPSSRVVVLHDVRYPLVPPGLIGTLLDAMSDESGGAPAVAVTERPVTDTLKQVDPDGRILGTVDREQHRFVEAPHAYRLRRLRAALVARGADPAARGADPAARGASEPLIDLLPRLVASSGGRLVSVPAPSSGIRLGASADLAVAGAVLGER